MAKGKTGRALKLFRTTAGFEDAYVTAPSRKAARQLIRHRHIEVKGRLLDIPSYQVRPGEEVRVKQSSRELVLVQSAMEQASKGASLSWIAVDKESFSGRVLEKPARTSIPLAAQEQLVVELYSK